MLSEATSGFSCSAMTVKMLTNVKPATRIVLRISGVKPMVPGSSALALFGV